MEYVAEEKPENFKKKVNKLITELSKIATKAEKSGIDSAKSGPTYEINNGKILLRYKPIDADTVVDLLRVFLFENNIELPYVHFINNDYAVIFSAYYAYSAISIIYYTNETGKFILLDKIKKAQALPIDLIQELNKNDKEPVDDKF